MTLEDKHLQDYEDESPVLRVVQYLMRNAPTTQYRIAKDLRMEISLVAYHVKKLIGKGICWKLEDKKIEIQQPLKHIKQYEELLEPLVIEIIKDVNFSSVNGIDPEDLLTELVLYILLSFAVCFK